MREHTTLSLFGLAAGCWLAAGIAMAAQMKDADLAKTLPPPKGAIWTDDADDWVMEPFIGNNTAGTFLQGPAAEAGFGAGEERVYTMAFDDEGNAYAAAEGFVARADKAGSLRYLAGIPGVFGFRDGPAERALFSGIRGLARGPQGQLYVLDRGNFCIRQLSRADGRWTVKTVAGTPGKSGGADGAALEASFGDPCNLAANSKGELFTFDRNHIRKIAGGRVETLKMKPGVKPFNLIMGAYCCFDDKDFLYVADRWNFTVRKVDVASGDVTDLVGTTGMKQQPTRDGLVGQAGFHDSPGYVIFDPLRQCFYTNGVDESFFRRCKDGVIKTLGGGPPNKWWFGPAKGAAMAGANIVAVDKQGDLYHVDHLYCGIRKVHYTGKPLPPKETKGGGQ